MTRNGRLVTTLPPEKRHSPVQHSPITDAAIHVNWNRDLFVAMGEDTRRRRLEHAPPVQAAGPLHLAGRG